LFAVGAGLVDRADLAAGAEQERTGRGGPGEENAGRDDLGDEKDRQQGESTDSAAEVSQ
jgi:hypothetical protein